MAVEALIYICYVKHYPIFTYSPIPTELTVVMFWTFTGMVRWSMFPLKLRFCQRVCIAIWPLIYSFQVFCLGWNLQRALFTPRQNILSLWPPFFLSRFSRESNQTSGIIYYSFLRPTTHPAAVYLSSIYYITYYYSFFLSYHRGFNSCWGRR